MDPVIAWERRSAVVLRAGRDVVVRETSGTVSVASERGTPQFIALQDVVGGAAFSSSAFDFGASDGTGSLGVHTACLRRRNYRDSWVAADGPHRSSRYPDIADMTKVGRRYDNSIPNLLDHRRLLLAVERPVVVNSELGIDTIDRAYDNCPQWRWANDDGGRNRRRYGSRRTFCRAPRGIDCAALTDPLQPKSA
jgi:hypothetical protein